MANSFVILLYECHSYCVIHSWLMHFHENRQNAIKYQLITPTNVPPGHPGWIFVNLSTGPFSVKWHSLDIPFLAAKTYTDWQLKLRKPELIMAFLQSKTVLKGWKFQSMYNLYDVHTLTFNLRITATQNNRGNISIYVPNHIQTTLAVIWICIMDSLL